MDIAAFGPDFIRTIPPGKILFIASMGEGPHGMGFSLPATPGIWKIHGSFKSDRKAKDQAGRPLWNGKISSKPVSVKVTQ